MKVNVVIIRPKPKLYFEAKICHAVSNGLAQHGHTTHVQETAKKSRFYKVFKTCHNALVVNTTEFSKIS